jgi:hypothetical protein
MSMSNPGGLRPDAVSLGDEEGVKQVLLNSILGLWDVVNNLTRLQPTRRERYRVTIFGSARAVPGTFAYEETKRAAAALAELGCDIVTGGGLSFDPPLANPEDIEIPHCVADADEAIALIRAHHAETIRASGEGKMGS